jgi:hypothetical protein
MVRFDILATKCKTQKRNPQKNEWNISGSGEENAKREIVAENKRKFGEEFI